jgi:hypothetical protein
VGCYWFLLGLWAIFVTSIARARDERDDPLKKKLTRDEMEEEREKKWYRGLPSCEHPALPSLLLLCPMWVPDTISFSFSSSTVDGFKQRFTI